jgi:5-methylthioadenosine/S-adenosylhomocysteine deaminase
MEPADIRRGNELAVREMTSSGTTFFSDMYFDFEECIAAVEASGLRAAIGITVMDNHPKSHFEDIRDYIKNWKDPTGGRIQLVIAPHSIYTVSAERLRRCANFARHNGLLLHIHLSETRSEVENCIKEHGTTPVRYLDKLGFLGQDVIAAHCVHVDEEEWKILAKRGVTVSHCPCSNLKLGSGRFPYELAIASGCRITLGTDGASSSNCLDLREQMKFAALVAKMEGDTTLLPAEEVFRWATKNGAEFFGIDAGEIAVGKQADAVLVELGEPRMQPLHQLISNWVYAADTSVIRHVICAGHVLKG